MSLIKSYWLTVQRYRGFNIKKKQIEESILKIHSKSTKVVVKYIHRRTRDICMNVRTSSYLTIGVTRIRGINGWMKTGFPALPGKIIRSFTKFRGRDSCANGNVRAITPILRPTARHITSANAEAVRTRSFVRMAHYLIRRDWSAHGGTPWIAPARKVSTPLTRRLQKQWRKLIGEHALRNELFKIHTVRLYSIRMQLRNRHLLISRGVSTKKRCSNIFFNVSVELSHMNYFMKWW